MTSTVFGGAPGQGYVELPDGRRGMRKHRSHDVVAVDDCLLEAPGPASYTVLGRTFSVATDGFWQVHPGAPQVLVETVLAALDPKPGERALDLYAGVGLFASFLADRVLADRVLAEQRRPGAVAAVEADGLACSHAERNLGARVRVVRGPVDRVLASDASLVGDLVVLDPPREGAKRRVVEQVVARSPRAVAYVACDPAALARDVAIFAEHGYAMTSLRAFDLFPMTHHVECVALLEKTGSDLRRSDSR